MPENNTAFAVYFNEDTNKERTTSSLLPYIFGIISIVLGIACGFYYSELAAVTSKTHFSFTASDNKKLYPIPEITVNLNDAKNFIALRADLELANPADKQSVASSQSLLMDSFITYLKELTPSETAGAAGTYSLKEDMLQRANKILFPIGINNILFRKIEVKQSL